MTTGDNRATLSEPFVPKTPSAEWRKGFKTALVAMRICLCDAGGGSVKMVHGASVYMLADHEIDAAAQAALCRFGGKEKKEQL